MRTAKNKASLRTRPVTSKPINLIKQQAKAKSEEPLSRDATRMFPLQKYTDNFTTKKWKFSDKNSEIPHISAQNRDCGYWLEPPYWGISNEYLQSMFLSRNKKNNVYHC